MLDIDDYPKHNHPGFYPAEGVFVQGCPCCDLYHAALKAAEARYEKDFNRGVKNAWPDRLPEEFDYAALRQTGEAELKPGSPEWDKHYQGGTT